jgi:hypothetical protein
MDFYQRMPVSRFLKEVQAVADSSGSSMAAEAESTAK